MVQEHKTLADLVHADVKEEQVSSTKTLEELIGEMDTFAIRLKEFSNKAKVTSKSILKMIAHIRQRAQLREDNMRARIAKMESFIGGFPRPPLPQLAAPHLSLLTTDLSGDTPLGTAMVGGTDTTITANMLFNLVRELQGKVDRLTE